MQNIEFVEGFSKTRRQAFPQPARRIALAHIDCDIYTALEYAYNVLKPHMLKSGHLVFDEALYSSINR